MAKTTRKGAAKTDALPETLQRSPAKAQRTFAKVLDAAAEQYGEGRRAHQTAFAAVKHSFEKVGDHWEPKDAPGPSEPTDLAREGGAPPGDRTTHGGVDATATRAHLYALARRLDVPGRSSMTKAELVEALQRANDLESARSRQS